MKCYAILNENRTGIKVEPSDGQLCIFVTEDRAFNTLANFNISGEEDFFDEPVTVEINL